VALVTHVRHGVAQLLQTDAPY